MHPLAVAAQLVERWLPKPKVAGSSPVYRSRRFLLETLVMLVVLDLNGLM